MAQSVMLNAVSYIICRYQTEQSILKRFQGAPSDNARLYNQEHLARHTGPTPKGSGWLILLSFPTHHPKNKKGD